jgi:hypothetical protein
MMGDRTVGLETLALSKMQTYTHMPLLSIVRQPTEEQVGRQGGGRQPGGLAIWLDGFLPLCAEVQPSCL